jgi:hypothetical protein
MKLGWKPLRVVLDNRVKQTNCSHPLLTSFCQFMWYRAYIVGVVKCSESSKHSFFIARLTILIPLHCCDCSGNVFAWLPNGDWMPLNEGCLQPHVLIHCCTSQPRLIFMRNGTHFSKTHCRMVLTVHVYLVILLCLCLPLTFHTYQIKTIFFFFT